MVREPHVCRDVDADTCDDCAITGADHSGGDVGNDGPDFDGDGTCDAGDPDRDDDGVPNGGDSDPLVFSLEQRRSNPAHWTVDVASVSRRTGGRTAVGAARGAGPWSRLRFEQLLLAQLGAYERSVG